MITLILDAPCTYLSGTDHPRSILGAPLCTGTVLDHLIDVSRGAGCADVHILVPPKSDALYTEELEQLRTDRASICVPGELGVLLGKLEPSDWILVLNPQCWPSSGLDLSAFTREQNRRFGAWFAVPLGAARDGAEERVHCDEQGRVQSIRRYYDHVTRLGAVGSDFPCAFIKACAVHPEDLTSMQQLRVAMAGRGILSRDVPVNTDLVNLSEERGLLAINERMLTHSSWTRTPAGYSQVEEAVISGRGALIHHSANIIPPVIIQRGVLIEENVTIIGPAVIGSGCTIQRDAIIAQSVIPSGVTVPAGARARHSASRVFRSAPQVAEEFENAEEFEPPLIEAEGRDVDHHAVLPQADALHHRRTYLMIKRITEALIAGASLIVLSPLLLLLAILVKLDSRGPVFFHHRRERVGGGRDFKCYKFRTMRADAHQMQRKLAAKNHASGPHFKIDNDPRVTRLGGLLRATNLDELPQLFNVLIGDMSLVGPRPSPFRENQVCVPWRRARLSVRPGITGLWQLCRTDRGDGDFQQWIFYDILYIRHLSPILDVKILLATLFSLGGRWPVPLAWLIDERSHDSRPRSGGSIMGPPRIAGTRMDAISVGR